MLWGPKFRHLSQTNGRTDIAPKGRCTTSTHIYSICIGFRLTRPKPSQEFRTKHWKKITWNCQMLSGPSVPTPLTDKRMDRRRSKIGGAQLQLIYSWSVKVSGWSGQNPRTSSTHKTWSVCVHARTHTQWRKFQVCPKSLKNP